jgi:hypothetical protein
MKILRSPTLLLILFIIGSQPAEASLADASPASLKPVGSGELTWLGLTVYHATLLTPEGSFEPETQHALKLDYQFRFSKEQLAKASLKEIERLYGKQTDGPAIIAQLEAVLSDVRKGDYILGLHQPGKGASFYNHDGFLGTLEDPKLARDFFSIWLHPDTSEPDLRAQLLGFAP